MIHRDKSRAHGTPWIIRIKNSPYYRGRGYSYKEMDSLIANFPGDAFQLDPGVLGDGTIALIGDLCDVLIMEYPVNCWTSEHAVMQYPKDCKDFDRFREYAEVTADIINDGKTPSIDLCKEYVRRSKKHG